MRSVKAVEWTNLSPPEPPSFAATICLMNEGSFRWIISPWQDQLFLFGGVLVSLLLTLGVWSTPSLAPWWWIWILLLDGPHVFATLARTYLDPEERRTRGRLLGGSLLWFLVGPACLGIAAWSGSGLSVALFLTFCNLWAWWHVLRQHLGFMGLYKRAGGETDPGDDRWDRAALYTGSIAPFVAFALLHPEARPMLGLQGPPTWESSVALLLWGGTAVVVGGWALRLASARRAGRPVAPAKVAYLGLVLLWTAVVMAPPVANRLPLGGITIAVTAWHNIQYHALVWHYKRRRYQTEPERYGLAARVGSHLAIYAFAGLAFTLAYRIPNCLMGSPPGCSSNPDPLFAGVTLATAGQVIFWGVALHHYFIDQYIWRPSKDVRLQADLGLVKG